MPFDRPTRTSLIQQAQTDMARALAVQALIRFSPEAAMAVVMAGLVDGLYGYQDWIARQSTPFTATGEFLEAWAGLVKVSRKQATTASGPAQFSGSLNALLPAGVAVSCPSNGLTYDVAADAAVSGNGLVTATIVAEVAGSAGNAPSGTVVALQAAVSGIDAQGVTSGPLVGGADEEDDDALRLRMLLQWAKPPQGGAAVDYVEWALAVPGVTRAWVNPLGAGVGTVVVYTMWDDAEGGAGGFPQGSNGVAAAETRDVPATGDQLLVADAIYPLRPVTPIVYSVAPVADPVPFIIHPKTPVPLVVQPLVDAAIDAVFLALASPLAEELETDAFETAIAAVAGMPRFTLLAPAAPIRAPIGSLPVRGTVTYA